MPKSSEALERAHQRLTEAVESIVSGEDWQRMLRIASKFYRYSFSNQLMIFLQKPDATMVTGFRKWQSLGRQVRKGEKGIAIFAPCRYKTTPSDDGPSAAPQPPSGNGPSAAPPDGEGKKSYELRGFRVVHVFDISQTDGEPIEDLESMRPELLSGDAPAHIWDGLVALAEDNCFEVIRHQKGSENGYCDFVSGRIGIRPDVEPLQAVKTLVHELGHALLHRDEVVSDRDRQEVEVESVAFIVLDALGLDSSSYSFPYVARWSEGDLDILTKTAERVARCAKQILEAMEAPNTPDTPRTGRGQAADTP